MLGQAGREPTDEELVQDFLKVALSTGGNEGTGVDRGYVTRFHGPVRIAVHGVADDVARQRIDQLVMQMRQVTGHDIGFAVAGEAANYHVHLLSTTNAEAIASAVFDQIPSLHNTLERDARQEGLASDVKKAMGWMQRQLCMAYYLPAKGRPDIESAHALISRGMSAERTRHCLAEEMAQVLGLPGDTRKAWPSRFTDNQRETDLSDYDWLYLRLLYDRDIRAGMTGGQVRLAALRLVRDWRSGDGQLAANPDSTPFDPAAYAPANELLLKKFMDWALTKESGSHRASTLSFLVPITTMIKWESDLRILITGFNKRLEYSFDIESEALSQVSGLHLMRADRSEHNAHLHIEADWRADTVLASFTEAVGERLTKHHQNNVRRLVLEGPKFSRPYRWELDYYAYKDWKTYYRFYSFKDDQCAPILLSRVLKGGSMAHIPWQSQFMAFRECGQNLSLYDLLFIRLLYDPRIRPNMKEAEALPVARQILEELRPDEAKRPDAERLIHPAWRTHQLQVGKK